MELPEGLTARPPRMEDAEAVTDLIAACEMVDQGEPDIVLEDVRSDWRRPSFDLRRDSLLVLDGERPVGYAEVLHKRVQVEVLPDARGRGVGTALLRWTERRALDDLPPGETVRVGQTVSDESRAAVRLLKSAGYSPQWNAWILRIRHREPPAPPVLPPGIRIREFAPGEEDRIVHDVMERAFSEWPDREPYPFEDWRAGSIERDGFEPWQIPVVVDRGKIVGMAYLIPYPGEGWVQQIAVSKSHRGRGLGRALLQHAFSEFHRRGEGVVGLSTDSRTGALDIYEHVGMKVERSFTRYSKDLVPAS
jgi:mycothiol synthase